jgi:EAL domain-containing protein (putative c-di-GMP-specific phosphodiesterase class I)
VRAEDIVGRLGGDEFIIILKAIDKPEQISSIAQDVCNTLNSDFMIHGHRIDVSTSIGITVYPQDAKTTDALLINADQAMYASKSNGSNGFMFFDETMREAMILRNNTMNDLKLALPKGQFELYYQPIYCLSTGNITKAEALIRWNHPERGMIRPDLFIQLAEESGLINEIGEWTFYEATNQLAEWRTKYSPQLQISINTSPIQYRDKGIDIEKWHAHLENSGLSGQALIVEITEGLLMESSSAVKERLWGLRDAGIEVAIDDFGTGYSSLSYLKRFHIDYLKIDQSFVSNLSEESEDFVLCEAITMMAHKLGCSVVAEGVETEEQSRLLKKANCDYGQGYLFSKPIPAEEFSRLLAGTETKQLT